MILKMFLLSFLVVLTGCVDDAPLPLFVDCGDGYFVQAPVSCPKYGAKF